jgi:hypothetical protein
MIRRVKSVALTLLPLVVAALAFNALVGPEPEPQQEQVALDWGLGPKV